MPQTDTRKSTRSTLDGSAPKSSSQERILKKRGYTLGRLLGEGSYAKVYLADYEDVKSGKKQKLACKLINGSSAPKDFLRKFFPREVEILSKVVHQYIIRVHSILQRKQKYYIFMQYAENGDLLEFIRANGPVRERQARVWFAQVVKGLKYLHDRDIAHRDMKCENLLLTSAYNVKISDFGFARYTVDDRGKALLSDTFCGSVSYAPPEIIRGQPYNCKQADLWSIGIVLYIMLNKAMPFDDSNLRKLYEAQKNRTWKVRTKLKDVLSQEVKDFLYVLLEPSPDKRKSADQIWGTPWVQNSSSPNISRSLAQDFQPGNPEELLEGRIGVDYSTFPKKEEPNPAPAPAPAPSYSPKLEPQTSVVITPEPSKPESVPELTREQSGMILGKHPMKEPKEGEDEHPVHIHIHNQTNSLDTEKHKYEDLVLEEIQENNSTFIPPSNRKTPGEGSELLAPED